ncbi:MAG: alpha/beta hydrolase [Bacteroidetes bacterium]|nr:alpha/beta hydrolase [Bacteroidota bacterium]
MPLLFLFVNQFLFSQEPGKVTLDNTAAFPIYSTIIKDSFIIQIAFPDNFRNSEKKYPAIYILDSNRTFGMAKDIVDWLSFGTEIPETVVVGISYQQDWWQKRSRDYTPTTGKMNNWGEWPMAGGADNFIRFIETELNPIIESRYKIDRDNQTIVGLSFGGLFANYVLFSKPELFDNYLMINPALIWNDRFIFGIGEDFKSKVQDSKIKVFTAVGMLDEVRIIEPWKEMNEMIKSQFPANVLWISKAYENQTHLSLLPAALTDGLKILLNGG